MKWIMHVHVLSCPGRLDAASPAGIFGNTQPTRTCRELFSVIGSQMYFYFPQRRGALPCWGRINIDSSGPATVE